MNRKIFGVFILLYQVSGEKMQECDQQLAAVTDYPLNELLLPSCLKGVKHNVILNKSDLIKCNNQVLLFRVLASLNCSFTLSLQYMENSNNHSNLMDTATVFGQVASRNSHMAYSPQAITPERLKFIDISMPFR